MRHRQLKQQVNETFRSLCVFASLHHHIQQWRDFAAIRRWLARGGRQLAATKAEIWSCRMAEAGRRTAVLSDLGQG